MTWRASAAAFLIGSDVHPTGSCAGRWSRLIGAEIRTSLVSTWTVTWNAISCDHGYGYVVYDPWTVIDCAWTSWIWSVIAIASCADALSRCDCGLCLYGSFWTPIWTVHHRPHHHYRRYRCGVCPLWRHLGSSCWRPPLSSAEIKGENKKHRQKVKTGGLCLVGKQ